MLVIPEAVIAVGVPIGLVILQFRFILQLLVSAGIVQEDEVVGANVPVIKPNVAVTFLVVVIETVQVPVPVQAPDQPRNLYPAVEVIVGAAVKVTEVPELYEVEQVVPQLI